MITVYRCLSIHHIRMKNSISLYCLYTPRNTHMLLCVRVRAFVCLIMPACAPVAFCPYLCTCVIRYVCVCIESSMLPGKGGMVLLGLGIQLSCQNSRRNIYPTRDAEMKAERGEQPGWFSRCSAVSRQTAIDQIGVWICWRYY